MSDALPLTQIQEGRDAAAQGRGWDSCPYTFWRAGVDQQTFDAQWCPKMEAWWRGWIEWQQQNPARAVYKHAAMIRL